MRTDFLLKGIFPFRGAYTNLVGRRCFMFNIIKRGSYRLVIYLSRTEIVLRLLGPIKQPPFRAENKLFLVWKSHEEHNEPLYGMVLILDSNSHRKEIDIFGEKRSDLLLLSI